MHTAKRPRVNAAEAHRGGDRAGGGGTPPAAHRPKPATGTPKHKTHMRTYNYTSTTHPPHIHHTHILHTSTTHCPEKRYDTLGAPAKQHIIAPPIRKD